MLVETPEKIEVGLVFKHKFSYTQEQVDQFAEATGDTNPLHIDEEAGKNSMFGRRIIHGYLGGAVFTKIFGTLLFADGNIYMKQEMKFLKPMFTGKEYEAVITVKEVIAEKNRAIYDCQVVDCETGDVTTMGEAMLMNKKYYV
ncbi:MAG: MaoC family dehydratase [Luteibaculum sp.]